MIVMVVASVVVSKVGVGDGGRRGVGEVGQVNGLALRVGDLDFGQCDRQCLRTGDFADHALDLAVLGHHLDEFVDVHAVLLGRLHQVLKQFVLSDLNLFLFGEFVEQNLHTERAGGRFGDLGAVSVVLFATLLLEVAFDQECRDFACPFVISVDRLFYQFPIGANLTATFGARVEQDDMLAQVPSVYPDDTLLNVMTLAGAPGAYNNNLGSGAGLWWKDRGWSLSANYIASNGDISNPSVGGIGTAGAEGAGTLQLGYSQEAWGLAAIYSWVQGGFEITGATPQASLAFTDGSHTDAFGLSGFWQPGTNGWIPSISVGWGLNSTAYGDDPSPTAVTTSQSWMVGLQWKDAFMKDNTLGFGIGQPIFATALRDGSTPNDGNVVLEGWYKFQLTDNISLMPALFYLNRPLGQDTPASRSFHQLGGLMKTTFNF